jgi:hypothetical protein
MPTPPSSDVALRCAERWYESLHTTFASRREVPHLPLPFRLGQGGLNSSLMKMLTAQAAGHHQMGPHLTAAVLLPPQTHGDQRVLLLCPRILPGPSKIRNRPQSNTLDEPLWGRKRGPDRVMCLVMESTHHTARTVGYSGESCTRMSNGFP